MQSVGLADLKIDRGYTWQRLTAPARPSEARQFRALWNDAREVKEALSRQPSAGLFVDPADIDVLVTREEFERGAAPLLGRTVEMTAACVRDARVPNGHVTGVFLMGAAAGSRSSPPCCTALSASLRRLPTSQKRWWPRGR